MNPTTLKFGIVGGFVLVLLGVVWSLRTGGEAGSGNSNSATPPSTLGSTPPANRNATPSPGASNANAFVRTPPPPGSPVVPPAAPTTPGARVPEHRTAADEIRTSPDTRPAPPVIHSSTDRPGGPTTATATRDVPPPLPTGPSAAPSAASPASTPPAPLTTSTTTTRPEISSANSPAVPTRPEERETRPAEPPVKTSINQNSNAAPERPVPPATPVDATAPPAGWRRYTVRGAESVGFLAREEYGSTRFWRQIAEANPGVDVDRLKPGQMLLLPPRDLVLSGAAIRPPTAAAPPAGPVTPSPVAPHVDSRPENAAPADPRNATPAPAGPRTRPTPPSTSPREAAGGGTYTVAAGDTLSKIASRELGSASLWRQIYELNRDVLKSENQLLEGMKLRLPARPADRPSTAPRNGRNAPAGSTRPSGGGSGSRRNDARAASAREPGNARLAAAAPRTKPKPGPKAKPTSRSAQPKSSKKATNGPSGSRAAKRSPAKPPTRTPASGRPARPPGLVKHVATGPRVP